MSCLCLVVLTSSSCDVVYSLISWYLYTSVGSARSPFRRSLRPDDEGQYECHLKMNVSGVELPAAQSMQLIVHCE